MDDASDRLPGAFIAAAALPALLGAVYVAALLGPAAFPLFFLAAFVVAGFHVVFLAVPIHGMLRLRRTPGPTLVLVAAFLIGGLPMPLLFGSLLSDSVLFFGVLGVSGGVAFLMMTGLADEA